MFADISVHALENVLGSLLNETPSAVTMSQMMLCTLCSIGLGGCLAALHLFSHKEHSSRSFLLSLVLLPVIVQVVIMLVNGNLGVGVAVMGAFGLIRFRSMPGSAREISSVFLAMAVGLADGMGYIGVAAFLVAAVALVTWVFDRLPVPDMQLLTRELKITIPEDLDYSGIFDDIFARFTRRAELVRVKTVDMGSLYELDHRIVLKSQEEEKQMLDMIRCRNGNLTIVCGRRGEQREML